MSDKISIELLKALETLASTVTTLQRYCSIKATLFTDAVTTILLECAAILAARSIRANNSPPKIIQSLFLGKTKSVSVVRDSEGCFGLILYVNVIIFLFIYVF
jgi:hypothetical protein